MYFNNNVCIMYFSVYIVYLNKCKKTATKSVLNAKKRGKDGNIWSEQWI